MGLDEGRPQQRRLAFLLQGPVALDRRHDRGVRSDPPGGEVIPLPLVREQIRRAVANTAASPRVRFVDTSFIVSPLWDSSTDWGHVCPQASHVEALYLVAVVMGLLEPNT